MINVTAAIIEKDGKVLTARRKSGKHLAGYWEFPGGKIEDNETPEECLRRELLEEFNIDSIIGSFIGESIYDYDSKIVRLLAYRVEHLKGEFQLIDHDKLRWLELNELDDVNWAPADIPLVEQYKVLAKTSAYYRDNALSYCDETVNFNLHELYPILLDQIPKNSHILDMGCGSGRDSRAFSNAGYTVTAMDASQSIATYAEKLLNQPVLVCSFQEMKFHDEFDGIWACASLLHCPRSQITEVITIMANALKLDGVAYLSFKWGEDETIDDKGRYFNNYTDESINTLVSQVPNLSIVSVNTKIKLLRGNEQQWLNVLVRRTQ